ncbi:MAG TPA: hypothetical protein VH575_14655 [Gemmataceae bacterium]
MRIRPQPKYIAAEPPQASIKLHPGRHLLLRPLRRTTALERAAP